MAMISSSALARLKSIYGDVPSKDPAAGTDSLLIALVTLQLGRAAQIFQQKMAQGGCMAVADNLEGVAVYL
eukprot:996336-Prymnesium_polylepis.1